MMTTANDCMMIYLGGVLGFYHFDLLLVIAYSEAYLAIYSWEHGT